jgi:hypothetical protein
MKPEDRNLLEVHLLAQVSDVEQQIAKLQTQRDTLRDLLLKVRRENATLRDVTRKNSFDRILIENRVMNLLLAAAKTVPTQKLYWAALEINPRLRNNTFRSHLHRLKTKGLIESKAHGEWSVTEAARTAKGDETRVNRGGLPKYVAANSR